MAGRDFAFRLGDVFANLDSIAKVTVNLQCAALRTQHLVQTSTQTSSSTEFTSTTTETSWFATAYASTTGARSNDEERKGKESYKQHVRLH